jgi:hypothetical protein
LCREGQRRHGFAEYGGSSVATKNEQATEQEIIDEDIFEGRGARDRVSPPRWRSGAISGQQSGSG